MDTCTIERVIEIVEVVFVGLKCRGNGWKLV